MSQICNKCIPMFVILLFLWTYYAYVVELCVIKVASVVKKVLYLVGYHFCMLPVTINYFATMCIRSGEVPDHYRFGIIELEQLHRAGSEDQEIDRILERFCYYRGIHTYTRRNDRIRYCMKCKHIKPDRTHHCSSCKICVLKMDHHCPWMDNCIHFYNYKIFFLLLIHTSLYCLYYTCTCAEYVYEFCVSKNMELRQLNYVTRLIFVVAVVFALVYILTYIFTGEDYRKSSFFAVLILAGIAVTALLGLHIALMLRNQTTLEAMSEPVFINNCTFDLGKTENFLEVFGYNWCLWFLPIQSSLGNGVQFPIRYNY